MSVLFSPISLGTLQIPNRFVHSATYEAMATETGEVTEALVKRYRTLAKGEVGLIIPGCMHVNHLGRGWKFGMGIHSDDRIPGLAGLVEAIHERGGKVIFQLYHAGMQTIKDLVGQSPVAPSSAVRNPVSFAKPREMTEEEIEQTVAAFAAAAGRAAEAGADGIQIHAAHGYLVNEFLSPFFNRRKDGWGGSDVNRFRFLKEIVEIVRRQLNGEKAVLVKLSSNDHTPTNGITPFLAGVYAKWLADLGIDGLELSCGSSLFSFMNMCRGDVPAKEMIAGLPFWKRPVAKLVFRKLVGKYDFTEGYNLEAAKILKPLIGKTPLLLVGGMRSAAYMAEILEKGYADGISMSRPFVREPLLVKRLREGKTEVASCVSCNKCLAAVANDRPLRCYVKGFSTEL
ncbi:MAG: NADH:flavin oxidoreductase [Deltaproteobacteria bacterium]|nr:NADH:flavin oxidoreductase [Deltaproteobacteria bacterium]